MTTWHRIRTAIDLALLVTSGLAATIGELYLISYQAPVWMVVACGLYVLGCLRTLQSREEP